MGEFYEDLFSKLDFDFSKHLKSEQLIFDRNPDLTKKLKHSTFYYKSPNNTSTSFYLIASQLDNDELSGVRKYIWNKNDADILFYYPSKDSDLVMYYAKYSPLVTNKDSILNKFNASDKDLAKIDDIKRWKFESGAFWLTYSKSIRKAKYKGIDKELVSTLNTLKDLLTETLSKIVKDDRTRTEIVQALIDRTLYIKYLEDNHIINSAFYNHYFNDASLNYRQLLEKGNQDKVNRLFEIIHKIFNNNLFEQPVIENKYLTGNVCTKIASSFNAELSTGQLRLYDFQFDILPVEFISYIYEVFLSNKQKANGIYYTPKKLAQLIVDDVINSNEIGAVLDPACGSGMFLIVAFQKLLEIAQSKGLEPENNIEKIRFRTKLLSNNIFGIEKEPIAQRFTLFSLSLQIFKGINPNDIKEYIANELKNNDKIDLFKEFLFFENIKESNTLGTNEQVVFENKKFNYIVGNPPFFKIKKEEHDIEYSFLNNYTIQLDNNTKKIAKDIVGKSQISQCFFLKIKEWSDENTRLGFVSNSSNFYNDDSFDFQNYFYSYYEIKKIYELSRVKKILFEKAKENVVALIFTNNNKQNNDIEYYPVDLGLFSEKPFELLIIQEDKAITINQKELKDKKIRLRDFLIGNEYDLNLLFSLNNLDILKKYIQIDHLGNPLINEGLKIVGEEAISKEYDVNKEKWRNLTRKEQLKFFESFKQKYTSNTQNSNYPIELLKPSNIIPFDYKDISIFLKEDISNFERGRNPNIYLNEKIIFNRTGSSINSFYSENKIYFDFDLHSFKLKNKEYYHLINAILNSQFANYYINFFLRKRISGSYPKVGNIDILNIPIPQELNSDIANEISEISKNLTKGKYNYEEKQNELNELIFDLYDLSYLEKQRIRDYFSPEPKNKKINNINQEVYKQALINTIGIYFINDIVVEFSSTDFDLLVAKVSFNNNKQSDTPDVHKVQKYILSEIFEQNPNENFLACQEKVFARDCVYIIKKAINKDWSKTKAFEDGQDILKHLTLSEDGERIHQD